MKGYGVYFAIGGLLHCLYWKLPPDFGWRFWLDLTLWPFILLLDWPLFTVHLPQSWQDDIGTLIGVGLLFTMLGAFFRHDKDPFPLFRDASREEGSRPRGGAAVRYTLGAALLLAAFLLLVEMMRWGIVPRLFDLPRMPGNGAVYPQPALAPQGSRSPDLPLWDHQVQTLYWNVIVGACADRREASECDPVRRLVRSNEYEVIRCSYGPTLPDGTGHVSYAFWYRRTPPDLASYVMKDGKSAFADLGKEPLDQCPARFGEARALHR